MKTLRSRRGSSLVTALFLLMFVLLLGTALVTLGMHGVQTTVNTRASQQAYYTAKSVLDATVKQMTDDDATLSAMDAQLKATNVNGVLNAGNISTGGLPADSVAFSLKCTDYPAVIENGIQKFTATATVTYEGYTRAVSKEIEVERRPGGIYGCMAGGQQTGNDVNLTSATIYGPFQTYGKAFIYLTDTTIDGDVNLGTYNGYNEIKLLGDTTLGGTDKSVEITTDRLHVLSASAKTIASSAITVNARQINYSGGSSESTCFPTGLSQSAYDDTTQNFKDPNWMFHCYDCNTVQSNNPDINVIRYTGSDSGPLEVDTGGDTVFVDLWKSTLTLDTPVVVKGGGSVIFLVRRDMTMNAGLDRQDDTAVTFFSPINNINLGNNTGNPITYEANFLSYREDLTFTANNVTLHGTVWYQGINTAKDVTGTVIDTRAPVEGDPWWGDAATSHFDLCFYPDTKGVTVQLTCTAKDYVES